MAAPLNNKNHLKHGLSHSRIDNIYKTMVGRCHCPTNYSYKKYGAKGIAVCEEWRNDREKFYEWAFANGYAENLTIDRIDPRGNYEPSNCRWVSYKVQANNKTNNFHIEYQGEIHTLSEWSDITGINAETIWNRVRNLGWSAEDALTIVPKRGNNQFSGKNKTA